MGSTATLANTYLRDFFIDGVPASGKNPPAKSDGRAAFADADTRLGNLELAQGSGFIGFSTKALLDGNLAYPANTIADVVADTVGPVSVRSRASNVATLTVTAHGLSVGNAVNARGVGGQGYNGRVTLTAATTNTFSYASTGADEAAMVDAGMVDRNGVYLKSGASGAGSWAWYADLPQNQQGNTTNGALDGLAPTLGQILVPSTDTGSPYTWIDRPDLLKAPIKQIDFSTSASYQAATSQNVTPSTGVTLAVSGQTMSLTSNIAYTALLGIATIYRVAPGRAVSFTGQLAAAPGGIVNAGIVLGFYPSTAPVLGGSPTTLPNDFTSLTWRPNGTLIAYDQLGTNVKGAPVVSEALGQLLYALADIVQMVVQFDDTGTGGALQFSVNGIVVYSAKLAGIPAGARLWFGFRTPGASGDSARITAPQLFANAFDGSKIIYVDPSAGGTGKGTDKDPYIGSQAISDVISDTSRRTIKIVMKRGVSRVGGLRFNGARWREVTVVAVGGHNADLYCSKSFSGGWTQPDSVGAPNVWAIPNPWGGTSGGIYSSGGLVDLNASQNCGRTGATRSPLTIYTRLTDNLSRATLNLAAAQQCFSIQTTGADIGKVLVNARGSANPNGIVFEMPITEFGINVYATNGGDFNACRLNISGVRVWFPYLAGIWAERTILDLSNTESRYCTQGNGFQLNQCTGRVADCTSFGTAADGFNLGAGILDLSQPDREPIITLLNCEHHGSPQLNLSHPNVYNANLVGDGFSNEENCFMNLINCRAYSPTKDGISAVDKFTSSNFICEDASNAGITLVNGNGFPYKDTTGLVFGGRLRANLVGINVTTVGGVGSASLDAIKTIIDSSVNSSISATGTRAATVTSYDTETLGAVPSGGHKVTSGSGVITIANGTLLT